MEGMEEVMAALIGKGGDLCLPDCRISDGLISVLANLPIERLCVARNNIGDLGAECLSRSKTLRDLDISFNRITDAGCGMLARSRKLKALHVGRNQISDVGAGLLAEAGFLESLYLTGNKISDAGAIPLFALTSLKFLCLSHTDITNRTIFELVRSVTIETIVLHSVNVDGDGVAALREMCIKRPSVRVEGVVLGKWQRGYASGQSRLPGRTI